MKKISKKVMAIILATIISLAPVSSHAANNDAIISATNFLNAILNGAFFIAEKLFPSPDYPTAEEYFASESKNFYKGTENFINTPADGAEWSLGFGKASIVPENLTNGSKEYYTGGYFTQKVSYVYDDQGVNAIALNDGSGRGTAVFAAVDGIGIGNADVREIRAAVAEKLNKKGVNNDIIAININATHCHTVIDTQGFGISLLGDMFVNMFSFLPFVEPIRSIDEEFQAKMIDGASDAIVNAYLNMESGKLYYYETVGIGKNEEKGVYTDDEYSYLTNKRYDTEGFQHTFACFKFVPDNENSSATVFSNLGAHPTTIDRSTDKLSADFPHYIEKALNESGMNFMFIQGAQSPISVIKSGVKTQSVLDKVAKEAEGDENASDYTNAKSLGYEFARLISDGQINATEVAPLLNVEMRECKVELERGLIELGVASGLLGETAVYDSESSSGLSLISEVGYIEIGNDIVMLTVPGELVPQLIYGNVVAAEDSYLGTDWKLSPTADIIGADKTVLVMGLCNDAIGYIIPDNDYAPFIADSLWGMEIGNFRLGEELYGKYHRHYEEMLSAGSNSASDVISALNSIAESRN